MPAHASSHREAPYITTRPKVDGTDFYMFRSYEGVSADGTGGRSDYVTLIANYLPLQDPYGGPNYFSLDPDALYEIHIDNNGDSREDITFQFRFKNNRKNVQLDIGDKKVAIPLIQAGQVADRNAAALNVNETYSVSIVRGDRRNGTRSAITNAAEWQQPLSTSRWTTSAPRPSPTTPAYAAKHIYSVNIPGCGQPGKVFVGQRKEPIRGQSRDHLRSGQCAGIGDHQSEPDQRSAKHHSTTPTSPRWRSKSTRVA